MRNTYREVGVLIIAEDEMSNGIITISPTKAKKNLDGCVAIIKEAVDKPRLIHSSK